MMSSSLRVGSAESRRFDDCTQSSRFAISHEADVGEVRRTMRGVALRSGFSEADAERLAIVTTELGNNIVRHAGGGEICASRVRGEIPVFELVAIDRGPGIPSLREALEDGYSTAGTSGVGFGAIRRQSDQFDAHSESEGGTVVMSRIAKDRIGIERRARNLAGICLPKRGEEVSGDAWAFDGTRKALRIIVADGLGHGFQAADASTMAVERLADTTSEPIVDVLAAIHQALRSTRGAAVSIADVRTDGTVDYGGLGNVRGLLSSIDKSAELVSLNGTLGHIVGRMKTFSYECGDEPILIMHSDGLKSKWKLEDFRGLRARHPAIIAGVLLRECERLTDDVCIFVWKKEAP